MELCGKHMDWNLWECSSNQFRGVAHYDMVLFLYRLSYLPGTTLPWMGKPGPGWYLETWNAVRDYSKAEVGSNKTKEHTSHTTILS